MAPIVIVGMFVSFEADTPILLKDNGHHEKTIDTDINDLAQPPHQLLDDAHDGVLAFQVTPTIPTGTVHLTMQLNGTQFFDSHFGPPDSMTRTWHEIIHGSSLNPHNNRLHIKADFADIASADIGKVKVQLSDFVLSYHAKITL